MICPNCGNTCDDKQEFCNKCGSKMNILPDNSEPFRIRQPLQTTSNIMVIEDDEEEEMTKYLNRDLNANKKSKNYSKLDYIDDDLEDEYVAIKKKRNKNNKQPYTSDKKGLGGKKVVLIGLLTILLVALAVGITFLIKKSAMTKAFDNYYKKGNQYYAQKEYKDARTQFYNASRNSFTDGQKRLSYEMVYKIDIILGGYDNEAMEFLEALIEIDETNVEYYKDLIVLYQNNDMEAKIEGLVKRAPSSIRGELESFDGTIPVANIEEGTYDRPISVELSSAEGAVIYYTIDGTNPFDSDTKIEYSVPINLEKEEIYTIRAYAVDKNNNSSKEMTVKYILDFGKVNPPIVSQASGTYNEKTKIEVTADQDCTIYYTTDGTIPTKSSAKYKKPIEMPKGNSIYYFIAIDADGVESSVVTRVFDYEPTYTINYDSAINSLSEKLVEEGVLENQYGEFEDGKQAYFEYKSIVEIDKESYYIIVCNIEDEKNKVSSDTYAVSCDSGTSYKASSAGDSYSLTEF